jgi:hypothetical protein
MKRLILLLAVLLALAPRAQAQGLGAPQTVSVQDSGTACSVAFTCATFTAAGVAVVPSLTLQVSGTWTGTLTFEATGDGANWVTVIGVNVTSGAQVTTTTASGLFAFANVGIVGVRARATAAMTGSAFVAAARGSAVARLLVPGSSFAGTFAANALCLDVANTDACLQRQASGIVNLTAGVGGTTFSRVNFGTAIASNPSLRRNGTSLETILADASAYTTHSALTFNAQAAGSFFWTTRSIFMAPADGQVTVTNNAGTAGFLLDGATDGVLKVRNRAGTAGTGTVDYGNKISATGFVFANIAAVLTANGDMAYCSDCTLANPCAGGGSGALAKRLNGVNVCN